MRERLGVFRDTNATTTRLKKEFPVLDTARTQPRSHDEERTKTTIMDVLHARVLHHHD